MLGRNPRLDRPVAARAPGWHGVVRRNLAVPRALVPEARGRGAHPVPRAARLYCMWGRRLAKFGRGSPSPGGWTATLVCAVWTRDDLLFEEAVGVDADEEMLAEAERQAVAAGITNIEWVHGKGEDISPDMGHFRVASMAASFHWMDRGRVAGLLRQRLIDDGVVAYVRATMQRGVDGTVPLSHSRPPRIRSMLWSPSSWVRGAGPAWVTATWIRMMSMPGRTPGFSGQRASPGPRG